MLASFTVVPHVCRGMLAPVLSHGDSSASCRTEVQSSMCRSTGCCWGGRGAGVQHQLLLPVCTVGHGAKGKWVRAAWRSSGGYLSSSSFLSFLSFTAEFRGCCCGREGVKGKMRCFGQGEEKLALAGVVREACAGCARWTEAGKGLRQMLAWRGDCCWSVPGRGANPALVPGVDGVGSLWAGNSFWRDEEPGISRCITAS